VVEVRPLTSRHAGTWLFNCGPWTEVSCASEEHSREEYLVEKSRLQVRGMHVAACHDASRWLAYIKAVLRHLGCSLPEAPRLLAYACGWLVKSGGSVVALRVAALLLHCRLSLVACRLSLVA
jgi:hypothetical protein